MSRNAVSALVALLSACARTQPPPDVGALRVAAFRDVTYRALNIFIADRGLPGHRGWRLERWTHDPARPGEGKFTRLAESPDSLCAKVLAASGDGSLVVLGGSQQALTVRRAPRYAPEPLAVPRASDAVVSADGTRILTGHADGRLRLWDARSLALVAESQPPPPAPLPPLRD